MPEVVFPDDGAFYESLREMGSYKTLKEILFLLANEVQVPRGGVPIEGYLKLQP